MKTAMMLIAAAGMGLIANVANAEDARVGVGVGPVGAGVTVGQSPRDERHTVEGAGYMRSGAAEVT
jgi:hypothetical protein